MSTSEWSMLQADAANPGQADNDLDGLIDTDDTDCDQPARCVGDCGNNGEVTVDEVLLALAIASDERPLDACAGIDSNTDGQGSIDELIAAVNAALNGCEAATD